jgi:putative FmdB family regulatory protein
MPFYEYECPSCRFYAEVMQKIADAPLKKCPSCGKTGFKRLISAPVFRLKGSGWYETDFKSDKEGKRNLAGEAAEAKPAEAKPADGKPEAKADSAAPAAGATRPADAGSASASASAPASATKGKPASGPAQSARPKPARRVRRASVRPK